MIREYSFINFFRASAALWVLSAHCFIWGGWGESLLPAPKLAVDLFMMISGYLMAANAFSRRQVEPLDNNRNYIRFWLRRFFRIAPAYYFSLFLAVFLGDGFLSGYSFLQEINPVRWPENGIYDPATIEYSVSNILLHVSFLFGLFPKASFSTFLPDWSLSLEMQFYLLFPFIFMVFKKLGTVRFSIFIVIPVFCFGWGVSKLLYYSEPSLIIFKLNYFVAGIILFNVLHNPNNIAVSKKYIQIMTAIVLVTLELKYRMQVIFLPVIWLVMFYMGKREIANTLPLRVKNILDSKVIRLASDASYGVYLFHGFAISIFGYLYLGMDVLNSAEPMVRTLILLVMTIFITYPLAYSIYLFIEKPGIGLGRKATNYILPKRALETCSLARD